MAELANSFEGGSDGTTMSAANTGGASGDAFDNVVASGVREFDTGITINDSVTGRLVATTAGQTPTLTWNSSWAGASEVWARMYFRVSDATPATNTTIINFKESNGSTVGCEVQLSTTGAIRLRAPYTLRYTSAYTLSNNTAVRLEVRVKSSATAGEIQGRLFYGANIDGTSPDESFGATGTAWDTGDGTVGGVSFGLLSTTGQDGLSMALDSVAISDSTWLGPVGSLPAAAEELVNGFVGDGTVSDGTTISTSNSDGTGDDAFDVASGPATLEYDDDIQLHGTYTARIVSTSNSMVMGWNTTSMPATTSEAWIRMYVRADDATLASNTPILYVKESDGTTNGCEIRWRTTGAFQIRANFIDQGSSTFTATADEWVRLELRVTSHASTGSMDLRIFHGLNLEGTIPDETVSATSANTGDGTIGGAVFGALASPGQTWTLHLDSIGISDTAWMGPVGTLTAAVWIGIPVISGTPVTPPSSGVSSILVPDTGAWFGATTTPTGGSGHSTPLGLSQWVSTVGSRPHLIARYYKGPGTQTIFNSDMLSMCDPPGQKHAIPFVHIKIGPDSSTAGTWRKVANGDYNSQIDNFADQMDAYGDRVMVALYHEPEDNVNTGENTRADYVNMWRHVVERIDARGVSNIVWVLQFMGYAGHALNSVGTGFTQMYAGDDYIDWIGWDPYTQRADRNTVEDLVNWTVGGPSGYNGFYDWCETYHPDKPLIVGETGTGIQKPGGAAGVTEAQAQSILEDWQTDIHTGFPQIKAWCWWNAIDNWDYQVQSRSLMAAEVQAITEMSFFDQDGDLAI